MKLKLNIVSLVAIISLGVIKCSELSGSELAQSFGIPELMSISEESTLKWFRERNHVTSESEMKNMLMNELKNPESFKVDRLILAKYCLEYFLDSQERIKEAYKNENSSNFNNCFKIIIENHDFNYLIHLIVKYKSNVYCEVYLLLKDFDIVKEFVQVLMKSAQAKDCLNVLKPFEGPSQLDILLNLHFISLSAPEEFYMKFLKGDVQLLYFVAMDAIKYFEKIPNGVETIRKLQSIFESIRSTNPGIDLIIKHLEIFLAKADSTLADLGIKISELSSQEKFYFIVCTQNTGRKVMLKEILDNTSENELMKYSEIVLNSHSSLNQEGLFIFSIILGLLPESIAHPIESSIGHGLSLQESTEYLFSAIHWMKLSKIEIVEIEKRAMHKLTFEADSEQVAKGSLEKMVYYGDAETLKKNLSKIKFISEDVHQALESQFQSQS